MPDHLFDYVDAPSIEIVSTKHEASSISVVFKNAPEKPAPGEPGKEAGDVLFVKYDRPVSELIVSLGETKKRKLDTFRVAGSALVRWMRKTGASQADIDLKAFEEFGDQEAFSALCEGIGLGAYKFNQYKTGDKEDSSSIHLYFRKDGGTQKYSDLLKIAQVTTNAINVARTWSHEPANVINPVTLAERCTAMAAKFGLKCTVLDDAALKELKAGAILAVGQGSKTPSRLIVLEYAGHNPSPDEKPVAIVGKAITFDSGGYSLKDSKNIVGMKYDKSGGILVVAALMAAAQLKLNQPIIGVIAAAENMVSAESYRPDDIITTLSGKTVEIISTDAEGRLVLADALTYTQKNYSPKCMIDLATLTGGVVVALGNIRAGIMSNNDQLAQSLIESGERTHEWLWRLPLDEEYFKLIKGDEADIKNSGGRGAHSTLGGMFLKQFVSDEVPWAHIDIAGMADTEEELPYSPKGSTGFGIRLLLDYIQK